ncbi:Uncharacterised protein [uncultured archaeon]|nr:Uncharacterised protein [uncultured archaeon]
MDMYKVRNMAVTVASPIKKIIVYNAQGEQGSIELTQETLEFKGIKNVSIKKSYVDAITKIADKALGKCDCEITYYDMFGGKEKIAVMMNENDYKILRRVCGK